MYVVKKKENQLSQSLGKAGRKTEILRSVYFITIGDTVRGLEALPSCIMHDVEIVEIFFTIALLIVM